jgi:hypothetical protein
MKIHIEYKIRESGTIQTFELKKEEYFEGDIAKFGDNIDYVLQQDKGLKKTDIEYTLLTIADSDDEKTQRETYFTDESELRYIRDATGWELVVQQIQISKDCFIITRMDRESITADWKNISFSTILKPSTKDEQVFRAHKGEYITTLSKDD